jgi:hypothetical protein
MLAEDSCPRLAPQLVDHAPNVEDAIALYKAPNDDP